ncbi:MAG: hypothetical protein EZS28_004283 [Streblomastix strix]|uniref:Uncharacterized protein n=1 Tax=Streblomastix strix TaxID=222440 RepID=A0A5J4WZA7_9EUKA|nr:MAG: hypothetical protein EZS28_004283 [Streblomastix strix]
MKGMNDDEEELFDDELDDQLENEKELLEDELDDELEDEAELFDDEIEDELNDELDDQPDEELYDNCVGKYLSIALCPHGDKEYANAASALLSHSKVIANTSVQIRFTILLNFNSDQSIQIYELYTQNNLIILGNTSISEQESFSKVLISVRRGLKILLNIGLPAGTTKHQFVLFVTSIIASK